MPYPVFARRPALSALRVVVLVAAVMAAAPALAERASAAKSMGSLCAVGIASQERTLGIPRNLLAAISLAESGRWDDSSQEIVAWPWTVMAEGEGRFLASKAEAIAEVRALQARGVTNIDVGCMQINLQHHPDAFAGLEQAFDPAANTAYAARFLASLRDSAGSWTLAAAHYHSRTPERAKAYGDKVRRLWAGLGGTVRDGTDRPKRPAGGVPGEESVFDDVFTDPPAVRAATPRRRPAIVPIDYERTAALNGQLRAGRVGVQDGGGASSGPRADVLAGQGASLNPAVVPGAVPRLAQQRARVEPDPVRSHDLGAFAAKRQGQLARWRRDGRL